MRFKKQLFAVALTAMTIAGCGATASAATLEEGWALYDSSNFSKSAEVFRSLKPIPPIALGALCRLAVMKSAISDPATDMEYCNQGVAANDPESLVWMGIAAVEGSDRMGIAVDKTLGYGYLSKASIAGFPVANDVLCYYLSESGDLGHATPFCKVAAASGQNNGLYYLAVMSIEGKGAIQDFEKGRDFALLSASMNNYSAYMLLGNIAKSGKYGKPKDFVAAYAWYLLAGAVASGNNEPQKLRDELGLDAEKIAQAQKMAATWKKKDGVKWRDLYPTAAK